MSGRRTLEIMVVSGLPPPCTASVNFAMKSELGTFSLLTVTFGYLSLNALVTLARPSISLWLVNVCQYETVPVSAAGLAAAVGAGAVVGDTPGGATACGVHAATRSAPPPSAVELRNSR